MTKTHKHVLIYGGVGVLAVAIYLYVNHKSISATVSTQSVGQYTAQTPNGAFTVGYAPGGSSFNFHSSVHMLTPLFGFIGYSGQYGGRNGVVKG